MTQNSTAIAKREARANNRLSLADTIRDEVPAIKELAALYHESGAFPDVKSVAQAFVKIKTGYDLGFSPHVALAGIHFIQGKAVIGANLLASLIKDSGRYDYTITKHTASECELQFFQRLSDGQWAKMGVPVRYTVEDAQNAGLSGKDNWKKYPQDMLFAACIRQGTRRYCADVLRGTPTFGSYNQAESDIDGQAVEMFGQSPNIVDGHEAEESASDAERESAIESLRQVCADLNAAGDDPKWSNVRLNKYADEFLNSSGGLEALNASAVNALRSSLESRLSAMQTAPQSEPEDVQGIIEAEIISETPNPSESSAEDLRIAAKEWYSSSPADAKKKANEWLGQRTIGTLEADDLRAFFDTFCG